MAKPDFPALLAPGVHALTLPGLHALAVAPFPMDVKRQDLFQKLSTWAIAVQSSGAGGILWIDGSFLTRKSGPEDIDCVLWSPSWSSPANATPANQQQLQHLLDRSVAETLYGLDLYIVAPTPSDAFNQEAYWRGVFSFAHDRITAKGFAEVQL